MVNEVVVNYKAKIDFDVLGQLEEQMARLKKFLLDAIVKRKNMRISTLLAMSKAHQFEASLRASKNNGTAIR